MFRSVVRSLGPLAAFAALISSSRAASGQSAPSADQVARSSAADTEELPAYHHSIFSWEHTLSAATLGVGDKPQSYDPTYTMGFVAKTRYYLVDNTPKGEHLSVRLDGGLYHEMTNSDVTTRRGEWDFSDTDLALVYARRFLGPADTDGTFFEVRPVTLTLPTSKISYDSGRYFAPGVLVGITNVTPLFPGKLENFSSTERFSIGYKRWFARATVPTNTSLERVRLSPDGRSLPSDSLSGSSLVRDQLEFTARWRLELTENVLWTSDASFAPSWLYDVKPDVMLCGVVLTGCADIKPSGSDSRYLVQTSFNTEISVRIAKGFSLDVGYGNAANQLGLDGRRRGFFYSPQSVFYASVSFFPHELATGSKRLAKSLTVPTVL